MTANATVSSNCFRAGLLALAWSLSMWAAPALAAADDNVRDREPGVRDIAITPLSDLNLARDEIPSALSHAAANPYDSTGLNGCDDLAAAILELDRLLGADLDIATGERRDLTVGRVAKSAVASLIPFRGIVRELSGAADHQRNFEEAIFAGAVRRGYLKGLGQQRGCSYPARPAFLRIELSERDRVHVPNGTFNDNRARLTSLSVPTDETATSPADPEAPAPR